MLDLQKPHPKRKKPGPHSSAAGSPLHPVLQDLTRTPASVPFKGICADIRADPNATTAEGFDPKNKGFEGTQGFQSGGFSVGCLWMLVQSECPSRF